MKLKDRIRTELTVPMTFADLARAVFPMEHYRESWRGAVKGGPPGCYMSLSRALREMGCQIISGSDRRRMVYPPRKPG